jgi:hypothetical protein
VIDVDVLGEFLERVEALAAFRRARQALVADCADKNHCTAT